jgi:hypothetical protein
MPDGNGQVLSVQNKIPDLIRAFLTSKKNIDKCIELAGKYKLSGKDPLIVSRILNKIYFGEVGFTELPRMLETELKIAPEAAKNMALDYAGFELLPISSFLGDIDSFIRSLGGNPHDYPPDRVILRDVLPQDLVTDLLHEHPVMVPAHLEHRLREILESRVRNVRKDDETVLRLTRAEKIGGAELPHEEAARLVEALSAKVASVKISSDNEPMRIVAAPPATTIPVEAKPRQADSSSVAPTPYSLLLTPSTKSGHGFTDADEHEANIIREKVLPNIVSPAVFGFEEEVKEGTAAVLEATSIPLSVVMQERFKTIVISRLRGVRAATETRDLLGREQAKGGLGFTDVDADKLMALIEKQAAAVNGKREAMVKTEKTAFIKNSVESTLSKDESRKRNELEELDRMYSSLTGKVSKASILEEPRTKNQFPTNPPPPPAPVPAPTSVIQRPTPSPAPMPPVAPMRPPAPLLPPPVPSSAISATVIPQPIVGNQPTPQSAPMPPVTPMRPPSQDPAAAIPKPIVPVSPPPVVAAPFIAQPAPRPMPPAPTAPPVMPPRPPLSPKMQDVRPVAPPPRLAPLTGPVQELSNLTLSDFRRLSTDPIEACRKLSDKLDVLEEHSYAQRIEGVKAWQTSAVHKLYLDVINMAFSGGKPIASAIADALSAGRETLTEREVRAIMELNRQLKA